MTQFHKNSILLVGLEHVYGNKVTSVQQLGRKKHVANVSVVFERRKFYAEEKQLKTNKTLHWVPRMSVWMRRNGGTRFRRQLGKFRGCRAMKSERLSNKERQVIQPNVNQRGQSIWLSTNTAENQTFIKMHLWRMYWSEATFGKCEKRLTPSHYQQRVPRKPKMVTLALLSSNRDTLATFEAGGMLLCALNAVICRLCLLP